MADRSQYQKSMWKLKKKIQRQCDLGVLEWQADSKWALSTFITLKKDNTIRVVSNFRVINKWIVRKPFPIPKISTVLQELEGFTYATALDQLWDIIPLDWIPMHPKYVPLSYHGESTLTSGSQWALHVLLTLSKLRCLS